MVTKGTYIQEMSVKSTHHASAPYLENHILFLMTFFFSLSDIRLTGIHLEENDEKGIEESHKIFI